ncbi:tRNA adenosine(34) deaminase TadA [Candidatus Pseudothioglobus sp. Uisw_050_01]|uniref:tRNA adenosine(34) deaminase TadA n=1 Tax=Candidatus Pseudothioglobus sp. Uisw_050_01 TaxID=3230997 RepID=UPI003A84DC5B
MIEDEKWMSFALEQAGKAEKEGEVPVGAILVKDDLIIARAHNKPISTNDPTAHAEIHLLRAAGEELKNYRLPGTTLYVTLEPCAMCLGAIMHARIKRVVFGAHDPKTGVCGSSENFMEASCFNHKIDIASGVLENESKQLLKNFFNSRR